MISVILLFCVFFKAYSVHGRVAPSDGRDSNDQPKHIGEYSWVVAVYDSSNEYPICAGVIIDDWSVLTSCSCVTAVEYKSQAFPASPNSLLVVGGNPRLDGSFHESRTVTKIVPHEYCDPGWVGTRVDVAILKVNKSFKTKYYKHLSTVPLYHALKVVPMRQHLIAFTSKHSHCHILTFGFYKKISDTTKSYGYKFTSDNRLSVLDTKLATPAEKCQQSCLNESHCEYDFYNREDVCLVRFGSDVGPCGVLPGSPVFCEKSMWAMYMGKRHCSLNSDGVAVPSIISFLDFYLANVSSGKDGLVATTVKLLAICWIWMLS